MTLRWRDAAQSDLIAESRLRTEALSSGLISNSAFNGRGAGTMA